MGKSYFSSQRYLKINLRFLEKIKNDTYSKCAVKCRNVSRKENYNDFILLQISDVGKFTMILNPEQGTYSELYPPARFSPAEISLFSILPEQSFHRMRPESGKADLR